MNYYLLKLLADAANSLSGVVDQFSEFEEMELSRRAQEARKIVEELIINEATYREGRKYQEWCESDPVGNPKDHP